ncbi:hypothetical protein CCP3SC1AL1_360013 [Gammaproteobacteria bacterium]
MLFETIGEQKSSDSIGMSTSLEYEPKILAILKTPAQNPIL